jgi:hypothetical protein
MSMTAPGIVRHWLPKLAICGALATSASCLISVKDYPLERSGRDTGMDDAGSSGGAGERSVGGSNASSSGATGITDAGSGGTGAGVAGSCGQVRKAAALSFLGATDYDAGTSPSAVAEGDLDGDGAVDLAVANSGSNDVSILLNNGDGTFEPAAAYASGLGADSVVVGDLDGDQKPDLAVANLYTGRPGAASGDGAILINHGDGTFAAATSHDVGGFPSGIALADLDGDGKPDLALSNDESSGRAHILLNSGNGNFAPPVGYNCSANAGSLRLAI